MSVKSEAAPKAQSTAMSLSINGGLLQRKCACGGSAGLSGQCAECQKKQVNGKPLQRKLAISEPGDAYEQEADRVAEQVMRMSPADTEKKQNSSMSQPLVQQRVSGGTDGFNFAEALSIVHEVLNSPGHPLDTSTRAFFEPRFGQDFTHVRVHSGSLAEQSAREMHANAYTVGHSIAFGAGQFAPHTDGGRRLIAHELSHVMQQSDRVSALSQVQRDEAEGASAPESCPFKEPDAGGVANIIKGELPRGRAATYDVDELQTAWFHTRNQREVIANCCNAELAAAEHYFYSRYSVANHDYSPFEMKVLVWGYRYFNFLARRTGKCPKSPTTEGSRDWGYQGVEDANRDLLFQNLSQNNRLSDDGIMQAKLSIGASNDPLELEADRVANQVMRMSPVDIRKKQNGSMNRPLVQRRAGWTGTGLTEVPPSVDQVLNSPGQPLDAGTRDFFEPRFGHNFSNVRVHTDLLAAESARDVNANAYTVGHNIVFGAGQSETGSYERRRLFAHELTHVVQQSCTDGICLGETNGKSELSSSASAANGSEFPLSDFFGLGQQAASNGTLQREEATDIEAPDLEATPEAPNLDLPKAFADPTKNTDYIDNRLTAAGVGLSGTDFILFCEGIENPIALPISYIDLGSTNNVPVDQIIYSDREEALAHVPFMPPAPGTPSKFAYYRAVGGLIVPTTLSLATAPETVKLINAARDKLRQLVKDVTDTLVLAVISYVAFRLLSIGINRWIVNRRTLSVKRLREAQVEALPSPVFGGSATTSETVDLYHYGDLTGVEAFESTAAYPRLTRYEFGTSQSEIAQYTGTPKRPSLKYRYRIRVDREYLNKEFTSKDRGPYTEYGTKKPIKIPTKYFEKVGNIKPD